tara:strand:- start:103 stop:909 length:807 start_codon:yes stop_codon:yes gene_type:complete
MQNFVEPVATCPENNTMYNVLKTTPELSRKDLKNKERLNRLHFISLMVLTILSRFFNVTLQYPKVTDALQKYSRYDTVFAPSDDAIQDLVEWSGYDEFEEFVSVLWGEDEYEARLIAHHAVPESNLTLAQLRELKGPYRYLRDALGEVMPLKIESSPENVTIRALGSEGTIIKPDLIACNGIIHVIDSVLLPFDGDGVLDDEQKDELRDAIRALFELNGPGTIADDVIRKNVAAILLGYDPIENLDVALGLAPAPSPSVDEEGEQASR